jgi:hypothetical protein
LRWFGRGSRSEDLTQAVAEAKGGRRSDTVALCKMLDQGRLFLALSHSSPDLPEEGEIVLTESTNISVHQLWTESGERFAAAFTTEQVLAAATSRLGWKTDGGPLRYAALPARMVLANALRQIEAGEAAGLVINPLHESELELLAPELRSLADGNPTPLPGYIPRDSRVEKGERVINGQPAVPPAAELVQAIEAALARYPEVTGHRLFQMFRPETDIAPHLALNIHTKGSRQADDQPAIYEEIVSDVQEAIKGKAPPPGYIDILFNANLANS